MALEVGNTGLVKVIASVEEAVAQELVRGSVERVRAGGRHDGNLCALALAVTCRVGIRDDVELADGIDAKELARGSAGSDVDQRSPRVLHSVEQEEIVLRAAARDDEHVADRRIRCAYRTGTLGGVVHGAGVQRDELIVATAVQWQLFHLPGVHQAGSLLRGKVDGGGCVFHIDRFAAGDGKRDRKVKRLSYGEINARALVSCKACGCRSDGIGPHGDRRGREATRAIGRQAALVARIAVADEDCG